MFQEVSDQERKRARHVRGILSALGLCPTGDIGGPDYEQMEASRRADLHVTVERLDRFDVFTLWNAIRGLADAPQDAHDALFTLWQAASHAGDRAREQELWRIMRHDLAKKKHDVAGAVKAISAKLPAGLERLAFDAVVGELVEAGIIEPPADRASTLKAALEALAGPDGLVDELTAALEADPVSVLDLGELDNVAAELAAA